MDQLSSFANVTSVVGAADIVIRSAKALYDFAEKVAAAPADRLLLVSTLEKVTEVVSGAQQYAEQYRRSVYVVEDGLEPLQQLENLLKNCESEIKQLHDLVKAFALVPRTKFQDLKLRLGYASREEAIKRACDRLQGQMVQIMLSLHVTSGKHDIILRENIKLMDRNIADARSRQDKGFQDSQRAQILSTRSTQKMISDLGYRVAFNHETNMQVAKLVVSKLDEVSRYVMSASSTATETPNISFKGRGLEYLIVPLSQIPLYLQNIFQTPIQERQMLSSLDRDWICTELAHLLASAHEVAARSLRTFKPPGIFAPHFLTPMPMDHKTGGHTTKIAASTFYKHLPETGAIGTLGFRATFRTPGGLLTVEFTKRRQSQQGCDDSHEYLESRFLFSPAVINHAEAETTGVFLLLSRGWESIDSQPRLTRFIREVNVVSGHSEAFQCVRRNDVAGLRLLFAARKASPFDYSEDGSSLLCEAALGLKLECLELLLEQGADSANCHLGSSNLQDLSYVIWRNISYNYLIYKAPYCTIRKSLPLTVKAIGQRFGSDWAFKLDMACEKINMRRYGRTVSWWAARINAHEAISPNISRWDRSDYTPFLN